MLNIHGKNPKKYVVKYNPVQLKLNESKDKHFMLHNEGINLFSISTYDNNFDVLLESDAHSGYAQNFIINNNKIYVLANVYKKGGDRKVGIYTLDIDNLEVLSFTEIKGLTFAFYVRKTNDNTLKIYGNSSEKAKDTTIYTYNLSNKRTNLVVQSDIKTMWVSKVFDIDNKEIILNDFSIISLDENNKIKVEFQNNETLIELEYDKEGEIYYLLSGDIRQNKFSVSKLNNNFKVIERLPLETKDKVPTDLELR